MEVSRLDAIKILCRIADQDDPYWDHITDDWYDEKTDTWPSIYDVFEAIGVSNGEVDTARQGGDK